jgi:hypothetical protein
MDYLGDFGVILFDLKPQFRGQKELFKMILGPVLGLFCCYYGWLAWSDPERPRAERKRLQLVCRQMSLSFPC